MRAKSESRKEKKTFWFENGIVTFYRRCLDIQTLKQLFDISNLHKNNQILENMQVLEVT